MIRLQDLHPAPGARKDKKRKGRGNASGNGTYAGKGLKGQKARSGGGVRPGFEGGQMPIYRRLPKRGFTNIFKKIILPVNVGDLEMFESGAVIDEQALINAGLAKGNFDGVKLLGDGEVKASYTVKLELISAQAKSKIEAAGGSVEIPAGKVEVA